MVSFKTLRKGHAITLHHNKLRKRDPTCNSDALYKSPANGDTISAAKPFTVTWDTGYASCLPDGTTNVDIYLLSPASNTGHIKIFSSVPFTSGSYSNHLDPGWWNATDSVQLTVNMSPAGQLLATTPFAAGPVITVNTDGVKPSSDGVDPTIKTSGDVAQGGGLPKGSVAAAILLPIIAILIGLGFYIKISRKKQAERMRRFSHAINARMSRISGDWQQMAQGNNNEKFGVRNSTASGMRMSTVFGQGMEMDTRDDGARVSIANMPYSQSQPVGSRTSRFNPPTIGSRQSRISFAPDTNASRERLSTYSVGRGSRAFQNEEVPPVPRAEFGRATTNPMSVASASIYDVNSIYAVESHQHHEDAHAVLSPTQTTGPVALSNDDISNIDIAPALSMMRTGNPAAISSDDLLLTPPAPPSPTHAGSPLGSSFNAPPLSPLGSMPMQPQQPAVLMSPDDMLRQYAKAKAKSPLSSSVITPTVAYTPSAPSSPMYTAAGMRNLTGDSNI